MKHNLLLRRNGRCIVRFDTRDRDHISKAFQAVLDHHIISDSGKMTKGGDQTCVQLVFVKVTVHGHPPRDLFVVEIEVKRDWNLCGDSGYYTKTWKEIRPSKPGRKASEQQVGKMFCV